jgi:GTPase SAR1 family protein
MLCAPTLLQRKNTKYISKNDIDGNTAAGKSSLADFLINKKYYPQRQSTHGIRRWRWKTGADKSSLQVNIWDFGGQDYYHATHNLFLDDKGIFVLLHTSKEIHHKNASEQQWLPVNYWLANVRDNAGYGCPLWFVASKADKGETERPDTTLKKAYTVSKECSISVEDAYKGKGKAVRDFNAFTEDLIEELNTLRGDELPASWVEIRDVLLPKWRKNDKKIFLTRDEFKTRCENSLSPNKILLQDLQLSWDGLLLYLKGCGEVIYFENNAALHDIIFLSAEQLTKEIYATVLTKEVLQHNGVIDINKIAGTGKDNAKKYIEVLQSFGLIFQKPGTESLYVAPQYLPENPYEKMIGQNVPLAYIIHFSDYMSRSLITRFIVEYASKEPANHYWRYGAYFKNYGLNTFVKINAEEQKIYVHIQEGKNEYRYQLMKELFLFFTKITRNKEKEDDTIFARRKELIKANTELSADDVNYARVQEIKLAITTKSSKVRSTNDCYIDRKPVFNLLINEGTMIPKKIFLSYARVDKKYKEELDKHFAALKRDKRIEVWHDGAIEAGDVADEITKKELANADIVLLLLSPGFYEFKVYMGN